MNSIITPMGHHFVSTFNEYEGTQYADGYGWPRKAKFTTPTLKTSTWEAHIE